MRAADQGYISKFEVIWSARISAARRTKLGYRKLYNSCAISTVHAATRAGLHATGTALFVLHRTCKLGYDQ